jgi:hypothetical protein
MAPVPTLLLHRVRQSAWIACLAIFGIAFAPTLSRLLVEPTWGEVCSARTLTPGGEDVERTGDSTPSPGTGHLAHCPLCGLGSTPMVMPPARTVVFDGAGLAQHLPVLFLRAPRPLFAWASAQPRAPPSIS